MAIPITEHPQYGAEMARYQSAKTAAGETGDAAKSADVELAWAQTVNRLQNEMYERQQAAVARQEAVTKANEIMPGIPDAVLARLTDPADIIAAAEALKDQAEKNLPPAGQQPQGQQPQGAAPSWGSSAPTGAGQAQPDPDDPKAFQDRMAGLAEEVVVNAGRKPQAVEQFGKEYFDAHIAPAMFPAGYYQQRTGRTPVIDKTRKIVGER